VLARGLQPPEPPVPLPLRVRGLRHPQEPGFGSTGFLRGSLLIASDVICPSRTPCACCFDQNDDNDDARRPPGLHLRILGRPLRGGFLLYIPRREFELFRLFNRV
jgi:hypothetical protein